MPDSVKRYIGSGIYAEMFASDARVRLTTENGVSVTNEIWMDPADYTVLAEFVAEIYGTWLREHGFKLDA